MPIGSMVNGGEIMVWLSAAGPRGIFITLWHKISLFGLKYVVTKYSHSYFINANSEYNVIIVVIKLYLLKRIN
jgi:hypothetical protein